MARSRSCLPGAEITGVDESGAYEGTFSIKLGPTTAAYRGSLRMESVDEAARTGTLAENEVLRAAMAGAPRVHLVGLASDGGVHSGPKHLEALIGMAKVAGVQDLVVHAFTDGRDTLPHGGRGYLEELERWLQAAGRVAAVGGAAGLFVDAGGDDRETGIGKVGAVAVADRNQG